MKTQALRALPFAAAAALTIGVATDASAQTHFEIEAGGGFTVVDVETVASNDGAIAQDWSQPSFRLAGRALFASDSNRRFGAEAAYQHLYWYQVRIPYGSTPITRDYSVSVMKVLGLFRYDMESGTVLELGAGLAFGDTAAPATSVAFGFPVTPAVSIKVRADAVLYEQPTVPLGVGISYAFGSRGR